MAGDLRFQRCMVQRLTHFMMGVDVGSAESVTWPHESHAHFVDQGLSLEELLVGIVRHPAFIERSL